MSSPYFPFAVPALYLSVHIFSRAKVDSHMSMCVFVSSPAAYRMFFSCHALWLQLVAYTDLAVTLPLTYPSAWEAGSLTPSL